ncbi:uncharacterized protein K452DRAFT_355080 [Aplosporella prunicola CBS 121167]|uniref:Lipocalin-like domain-containing protein n=1 Tax=Aplosporella prunicola CBS 121167 TaxID=1176127 RepID=A0A6A6BRG4_9PEZI|nr:uncharacterized protein K452DRAFT_355080 [Aplosporella prunicola CBS 121167]KAF2146600.1 hypothetical protein K452DRAFT_355080 [Aplosporella prunicola CBS 121167]
MAAPANKTLNDLNGAWVMNKTLSGDSDAVLALQGVGWLTRTAIGLATITLHLKQYKDDAGTERIDIDQTLTGGIRGTREERALNWQWREHSDQIFGHVRGRSRRVAIGALSGEEKNAITDEDIAFMRDGWSEDIVQGGELIETYVTSLDNGWTAWQTWGFEVVEGQRRHARHVVVKDKDVQKVLRIKLIYDWVEHQ